MLKRTLLALTFLSTAAVAEPYITHDGKGYEPVFKDENQALKLWEYLPTGQKVENWQQMFTVHQYKVAVPATEIAKRIAALNNQQKSLLMFDEATSSVCFVVKNDTILEANAWRYAEKDGKTWGNALQWRFPVESKAGLKEELGPNSPFAKACEGMKSWEMKYPQ